MSSAAYLAKKFELRKGGSECNHPDCKKMPGKEVVLIEVDLAKKKKREIGTVYMCSDHYRDIRKVMDELKLASPGKVMEKRTFDIGFVTY